MLDEAHETNVELGKAGFSETIYFTSATHNEEQFREELKKAEVPPSLVSIYERNREAGGAVLMVHVDESNVERAGEIMRHHSIDTDSETFPLPYAAEIPND